MKNNLFLSGFWTRIWALLIDSLILGILGFILGFTFENIFISMGESAKFIGWAISLTYFSILITFRLTIKNLSILYPYERIKNRNSTAIWRMTRLSKRPLKHLSAAMSIKQIKAYST
ncbi:RDD family protein [Chryseobacterium sp. JM1]|uniref:RDD family protein n=1 Tax=Chryseobacterium sp. JM1 TaxID=1233950 RepID=UPI0026B7027F